MAWIRHAAACALILAACSRGALASALEEARALFDEGKEFLRKGRGPQADVIKWNKKAIAKFEEAVAKLEGARDGSAEAELQTDINALLFWTRRTTPMDMSAILGGSSRPSGPSGSGGGVTDPAPSPAPPAAAKPAAPPSAGAATKALARAEAYARRHPNDPMTCAAHFFEVADRFKDFPDIAFKAITRAQELQRVAKERAALRKAEARFGSLTPDEKLTVEGDRAYAAKRFDEAAEKYRRAISAKATPERYRKLGHARFVRAQEFRAEYSRAYIAAARDYRTARSRAAKEMAAARARAAGSIGKRAVATFVEAGDAFKSALATSPGRMDIDSELHVALTLRIRKEKYNRNKAQSMFESILFKYHGKLTTEEERTLYAYAETYAGSAAAAKVKRRIARKAAAASGVPGSSAEEPEKSPDEMSPRELRKAIADLKMKLKRDELRVKNSQLSGRFDRSLLERVNAERKQLKELEAVASRRGVR